MEDLLKFNTFNKLKEVYRLNDAGDRRESAAEHSWSCCLLADFLIDKFDYDFDRLKVYELLLYHDTLEISVGDEPLHPDRTRPSDREEKKTLAMRSLSEQLPKKIGEKYTQLFTEYQERKSREAQFAFAIDKLDPMIQGISHKYQWKGWSREFLINAKEKHFESFPELKQFFHDLLDYMEAEGYFSQ